MRCPPPFTFWSSFIFSNMLTKPLEHTAHKVHRERDLSQFLSQSELKRMEERGGTDDTIFIQL